MERTDADVLVIGGGMSGLATAARAAARGLRVVVAEKRPVLGGSAAYSAGILWTATDYPTLRGVAPDGDPERGRMLVEGFDQAVEDVRAAGVEVTERWGGHLGFGVAHRMDVHGFFAACRDRVLAGGGAVLLETPARALLADAARVHGARLAALDGALEVRAPSTVLATGGFQGDAELKQRLIGFNADDILVRSNPGSVGDGLRMSLAAGAAASRHLGAFYGHMVPSPLREFGPDQYLPVTQYHSAFCVLVNRAGRRFTDESLGDEVSNQMTLRQPGRRALLLCDERVRRERVATVPYPTGQLVDRFAHARDLGARLASADTLEELAARVAGWGFDAPGTLATIRDYARAAGGEAVALDAPLPADPQPLVEPPFHAQEVQPTITATFGGVRVDAEGGALDRDGAPVRGLYAVGTDAGGLQDLRWIGGLVVGLVFARRLAGRLAAAAG